MTKQHTIGDLINLSAGYLQTKGCASPRLDAELLLAHVLGLDRLALYLNLEKPLNEEEVAEYRNLIGRRGQRVPVAYLTGEKEFYSLGLQVNPEVLIPRPETELVVDKILELIDPEAQTAILELGTGSGAIAVALACQSPDIFVTATDLSTSALQVAEENTRRLEVTNQVTLLQSDLFAKVQGKFQIVCSNPPYIPQALIADLAPEVREEPVMALAGGVDGLDFYRRILNQAASFLEQPGFVVLEIGWDQGEQVRKLGEANGLTWLETVVDYGGQDRVVVFQWT